MPIKKPSQTSSFLRTLRGLSPSLAQAADAAQQRMDLNSPTPAAALAPSSPVRPVALAAVSARDTNWTRGQTAQRNPGAGAIKLSQEQEAVAQNYSPLLVVRSFAGTGKTTAAVAYTAARPNKKCLYMPFNRANRDDARARMGKNVDCFTGHAVARSAVGRPYGERIAPDWKAMTVRSEMGLLTHRSAAMVQATLTKYFVSADADLSIKHAQTLETSHGATEREVGESLTSARALWKRMQDQSDKVSLPHDAYLKIWALSKPKLPYDVIILDEYQDTNPVMEQVMSQQMHATRVFIGDEHQSIYAFRGAVNAMAKLEGKGTHLALTQTWRFGPEVARYANLVLQELKGEKLSLIGMGTDAAYVSGSPYTKLARTNAQLFQEAALLRGEGIHWVGGASKYQLHKILDAYHLFAKRRAAIRDPFIRNFASFGELKDYAEQARDSEVRVLAKVIEEFASDTPRLVDDILRNEVADPSQAAVTLTTGHRAKGLDWDYVELCNDFEVLLEAEADLAADPYAQIEEQELNLLYVSLTRAKKAIRPNSETATWIERLPEFRQARELAARRLQQKLLSTGQQHR